MQGLGDEQSGGETGREGNGEAVRTAVCWKRRREGEAGERGRLSFWFVRTDLNVKDGAAQTSEAPPHPVIFPLHSAACLVVPNCGRD